ncbi:MAG: peptide chain release factor 1 [Candidatus Eremiobacteraeota bacterium]|nr:peptide chain release factor 1 [Candidatus Eremiobacteraeota bacterium]
MEKRLGEIAEKYDELEKKFCDPAITSNPAELKKIAKERAELENIVKRYETWKTLKSHLDEAMSIIHSENDPELIKMAENEVEQLNEKISNLEEELSIMLLPSEPYADRDIIMEIRAGAGGEEAALFGANLFRMYLRYAERQGWESEIMSRNSTELGGIKEVIFSLSGKGVYSRMKYESGVHRVQRVPTTESGGRIHTSTVTVAVLPEPEEIDVKINPNDLRIDTYRSSGAGGQHVNKTDSAVRITHLPTGLVVSCQDERSQHQNREKALRILRAKLLEAQEKQQHDDIAQARRLQVGSGERCEKIRTYNFPQNRITDHRIGKSIHNLDAFLEGEMDDLLDALETEEIRLRLKKAG